ncbi:unnamed protein product [Lactuca virosa]|uniref:Uncharacterized protein n=1 Tax=Lactuca virosa TaxID=75947 RepID=A0AAU9NQP9_9ASTR|nr:unnamed protein product [Lactuca virosa]
MEYLNIKMLNENLKLAELRHVVCLFSLRIENEFAALHSTEQQYKKCSRFEERIQTLANFLSFIHPIIIRNR